MMFMISMKFVLIFFRITHIHVTHRQNINVCTNIQIFVNKKSLPNLAHFFVLICKYGTVLGELSTLIFGKATVLQLLFTERIKRSLHTKQARETKIQ